MASTEPAAAAPTEATAKKKKSKLPVLIVMVLMGVEGVGIFVFTKMFLIPTPATAEAAEGEHGEAANEDAHSGEHGEGGTHGKAADTAEVDLAECRPNNMVTGRLIHFKIRVSALVGSADAERAAELIKANQSRIHDRVNYVIRSAEPHHLGEAGLETIKRRMKREIDTILGDEKLVKEILIPEMLQSGSGV